MPLITALSPTDIPPKLAEGGSHIPGGLNARPSHKLYLDLQTFAWNPRPKELPRPKNNPEFLLEIRDAIFKSKQPGGVPIDAVHITCCSAGGPDLMLWEALADVQPSHLEMASGWDQTCNYMGLSEVQPPWNLKSLYMSAFQGNGSWDRHLEDATKQRHSFPACYATLETLVLDHPSQDSLYFYPVGGAKSLKSLTILENDAAMVFSRTVDCNPNLVETLSSLTLGCYNRPGVKSVLRIKRFLREASKLAILELDVEDARLHRFHKKPEGETDLSNSSLDHLRWVDPHEFDKVHIYTGLTNALPNTLQSFSLRGPANSVTLKELDKWIPRARDQNWLPNLRRIAFRLDDPVLSLERHLDLEAGGDTSYLTAQERESLKQKIEQLLNILRQRSPPVEVVKPRASTELRYPFPV